MCLSCEDIAWQSCAMLYVCIIRQGSSLPIRWGLFNSRSIALTHEGRSLVNDVLRMCASLKGEEGWVGMSSLSGIYSAPLSRHGRLSGLGPIDWRLLFNVKSTDPAKSITSGDVSAANIFTLLIKMPALVTFYREHCRTLCCLPGIISLIIMCIGIIFK